MVTLDQLAFPWLLPYLEAERRQATSAALWQVVLATAARQPAVWSALLGLRQCGGELRPGATGVQLAGAELSGPEDWKANTANWLDPNLPGIRRVLAEVRA